MEAIYNGSNSFRVFNNRVSEFIVGRRVKMDCGLDGIKYAAIVSSSYSAPYTTVQIDESDLTAALTDVWYAVVTAGAEGSIPDHSHDGSEGSGGIATSFSGIDDHDHAAYVPWDFGSSTISGTGDIYAGAFYGDGSTLSGIVTSGTDDHPHVAYVPWDFGTGTISGVGDIYCNDIYTSSGTVYIGDLQLTTSGGNLLVGGQNVAGQDYYFGEGEPAIPANIDDLYLDTNTGDVYRKISEFGDIIDINLCVGGTGYSDSIFNDDPAYGGDKAFDGLPATTLWHSKTTTYPIYIQYQFTESQTIGKLRMLSNSFNLRMPRDFTLKGSNTGAFSGEEVDIVSYSGEVYVASAWNELEFSNTAGAFIYYRINITGAGDSYQNIQEIEMMGIDTSGWELVYTHTQSFLGLTDTPTTYSGIEGNYLRTTASGITTVSGIILEASNGSEWLLQVTNSGTLYTTEVV